jgi:3-hydroxyacyl-CoA dehydrogenase/enoyl-CoA hydratase/3-hydroxybutyryl-CoA epimerase
MMMFPAANAIYRRETFDNYPAARAIMQCVYEGLQLPMDAALRVESRQFAHILQTKEAAAMIRSLFLSMQELNKGARRPQNVPPTKVKKLAVIGAGFMGASVGFVSARGGMEVVLIDRDQASGRQGPRSLHRSHRWPDRQGPRQGSRQDRADGADHGDRRLRRDQGMRPRHRGRVRGSRKVKAEIYKKVQPLLKEGAIIASNTSTLPINSLAEEFADQSEVHRHPLLLAGREDDAGGDHRRQEHRRRRAGRWRSTMSASSARRPSSSTTPAASSPIAACCVSRPKASEMLLEGVPPAMIENTAKMAGMPVGPLSLSDEIALDLVLKIMKATEADLGSQARRSGAEEADRRDGGEAGALRSQERQGLLRVSAEGQGLESALEGHRADLLPKPVDPDTLDVEELKQRFLVVQAVEAARTVEDHVIVDPREADVGSILGFGFAPFTGGTLSYIDFMGTKKFVELCHKLEAKYGSRFTPPKLLEEMAAKGETFYGRFPPKKLAAA